MLNEEKDALGLDAEAEHADVVAVSDLLPPNLFLLPTSHATLFPGMVVPLVLPEGKLTDTADFVMNGGGHVGVVFPRRSSIITATGGSGNGISPLVELEQEIASEEPAEETPVVAEDFYQYGVAGKIIKKINLPDNQLSVLVAGLQRFRIKKILKPKPHLVANVEYIYEDETKKSMEMEAMLRSALTQFKAISKDNPLITEEVKVALVNIDGPGKLTDFMSSVLVRDLPDYQKMLSLASVEERLRNLLVLLKKEKEVQDVQRKIQDDINQKIAGAQREYYLSEQLKMIQKELGGYAENRTKVIDKFRGRLKGKVLSKELQEQVDEEFDRLANLHEQSSEYSVSLNYLDWVTALPWGVRSEENYELRQARRVLDEDHYGLKEIKDRLLEFLAVRKLKKSHEGTILCFVGAPGTGKTSLGKSIARALGRRFYRFSVGGMRDEAEIKGHRRTYVGAMPGKILQGLKRVGTQNPVFLLDEVDKIGMSWASGGDPASALLEVLDPEQNSEFLDHYLDLPFDCSEILFVTTANSLDSIPGPLLDRMEVIELHGYSELEKFHIARNHLIPRQLKRHALKKTQVRFLDKGLKTLITSYARESGVRNLEKQIAKVCRKVAYRIATGRLKSERIDGPKVLEKYLGHIPYPSESHIPSVPGVATGLAWTPYGGEVLQVESMAIPAGTGGLKLTGQLGGVMQESANIAFTTVRHQNPSKVPKDYFDTHQIHLHVPAGATPKDGPSAGITMAASLLSLLTHKPLKKGVAMTGELTLSGRVLPVGGIKEKVLAARRAGIDTIVIPRENARDLKDLDPDVRKGLKFVKVSQLKDCMRHLF